MEPKIEANANRYSFIWLKSVTKNEAKLQVKIEKLLQQVNDSYLTSYSFDVKNPLPVLEACLLNLKEKVIEQSLEFVYGKGKRKTELQRQIETLEAFIEKQIIYLDYQKMIGSTRSSCSKNRSGCHLHANERRSHENGQLKPGYNVQIGVEAEYIVGVGVFQSANDVPTLIPFLDSLKGRLSRTFKQIIADAGYESRRKLYLFEGKPSKRFH